MVMMGMAEEQVVVVMVMMGMAEEEVVVVMVVLTIDLVGEK